MILNCGQVCNLEYGIFTLISILAIRPPNNQQNKFLFVISGGLSCIFFNTALHCNAGILSLSFISGGLSFSLVSGGLSWVFFNTALHSTSGRLSCVGRTQHSNCLTYIIIQNFIIILGVRHVCISIRLYTMAQDFPCPDSWRPAMTAHQVSKSVHPEVEAETALALLELDPTKLIQLKMSRFQCVFKVGKC